LDPLSQAWVPYMGPKQAATDNANVTDCEVKLWDTQTGRELVAVRRPYDRPISKLWFSPDGHQLVVSSKSESGAHTEVFDTATGQSIFSKLRGGSPVYSPDGRFLATFELDSGFRANFLHLWDPHTFHLVRTLRNPVDNGGSAQEVTMVFDSVGRRLAITSGNPDGTIKLLEVASGEQLQVLRGDPSLVESLCFTPDGERLVSSTPKGPVRLWDTQTGRCLLTLQSSLAMPGGDSPNIPWGAEHTRVAVSADGSCIATSGARLRLWRANPAKTK
jgi:WD40 repeat protein